MKLAKRLVMLRQSVALWTPAEITTALWLDDNGENGIDFNGAALHSTENIVVPEYCGVFVVLDTSNTTTAQVAVEHSANFGLNNGSFLLTVGEASGKINYGFKGISGFYVLEYPISSGKMTLGLLHNAARSLSVYNHGAQLTGSSFNTAATSFPAKTANLPIYVGARAGNVFPLSGQVRELVITPSVPSIDIRQRIEGYHAHKWDRILGESARVAALPSDHPYKTSAP